MPAPEDLGLISTSSLVRLVLTWSCLSSHLAVSGDSSEVEFRHKRRVVARSSLRVRVPQMVQVVEAQHLGLGSDAEQVVKGLRHAAGAVRGFSAGHQVIRQAELSKGAVWAAGEDALNCVVPLLRRSGLTACIAPRIRRGLHPALLVKAEPLTLAYIRDRGTV